MLFPVRLYFKDYWITFGFLVSVIFTTMIVLQVVSNIKPTDELIYLHYNIVFGVDLIGEWWRMYFIPAGAVAMFLINFLSSYLLYRNYLILSRLISVITATLEIFLFVASSLIVGLNI